MAYLNVAELPLAAPASASRRVTTPAAGLTPLEWSVVALAERDSLSSLRAPGRIATALASLFGTATSRSLADPALEALRHVAVHAWHHGFAIPVSAMKAVLAAGFTSEQLELVVKSVNRARADRRRAQERRRFGRANAVSC